MKKITLTLLVCISLAAVTNAQKTQFGFTGGATFSYWRVKGEQGSISSSNMTPGFSIGGIASIPVGKSFSFQPSLQFLQKGGLESQNGTSLAFHISYLDLPLNFMYVGEGTRGNIEIGLGPCLSYGLGGSAKADDGSNHASTPLHFGNENDAFQNAFEFSGNIVLGYQWHSGILVQANYNYGFSNLWGGVNAQNGQYFKNTYVGLRVGYLFGRKKA
jgi:hypothetical protein